MFKGFHDQQYSFPFPVEVGRLSASPSTTPKTEWKNTEAANFKKRKSNLLGPKL